jgi:hypothetical protein
MSSIAMSAEIVIRDIQPSDIDSVRAITHETFAYLFAIIRGQEGPRRVIAT